MALNFITRWIFLYRGGMPEPDSVAMAAGMARWFTSQIDFYDAFLYGRQLSPGIYFFFRIVYPAVFNDASHIIPFLNWIGLISSTLMVAPLYLIFRRRFDRRVTVGCILLILFSPLVWELGTFFHPIIPATLLFLLSFLAWNRISRSPAGAVSYLLTYLLASASVIMRLEILLVAPALCTAVILSPDRRRDMARLFSLLPLVAATYLAVVRSISKPADIPYHDMWKFIQIFGENLRLLLSFTAIKRTIIWACAGIGVGSVALAVFGSITRAAGSRLKSDKETEKGLKDYLVAVVWMVPVLILWLPRPVPIMRHFFLVTPAAGWMAGETVLRRCSTRRIITLVFIAIVCNLAVPEIFYRSYNIAHPESKKTPNGSFFYYHQMEAEGILRNHAMQTNVLSVFKKDSNNRDAGIVPGVFVAVTWDSYGYLLYALAQMNGIDRLPEITPDPGMYIRRYARGETEIRLALLEGYMTEPGLMNLLAQIETAGREGFRVFVPEEIVRTGIGPKLEEDSYTTY